MTLQNSFRLLTPAKYPLLKPFFHEMKHALAIYSLPSLIAWNSELNPTYYAIEDDLLLLTMPDASADASGGRCLLLPLSPHRDVTPRELTDLCQRHGLSTFCFIPGSYVDQYGPSDFEPLFSVTEQPDYDDYIYLRTDLILLKGSRYLKKRNHISKFCKLYVETGRASVEGLSSVNIPEALRFLEWWCAENNRCAPEENPNLALESAAARFMLEKLELLEARGMAVRIDGKIAAFAVVTSLTKQMRVLNFEKADAGIPGLYQFLDRECARKLFEGVKYINKESDMGSPGLAHSKESYNPIQRIRCFRLSLLTEEAVVQEEQDLRKKSDG